MSAEERRAIMSLQERVSNLEARFGRHVGDEDRHMPGTIEASASVACTCGGNYGVLDGPNDGHHPNCEIIRKRDGRPSGLGSCEVPDLSAAARLHWLIAAVRGEVTLTTAERYAACEPLLRAENRALGVAPHDATPMPGEAVAFERIENVLASWETTPRAIDVDRLIADVRDAIEKTMRRAADSSGRADLDALAQRIAKGRAKYPTGCTLLSLLDEAGEVAHAVNKRERHERVRDELLDVAAVAMRLYFGEIDTAWQPASPFTPATPAKEPG